MHALNRSTLSTMEIMGATRKAEVRAEPISRP